MLNIDPVFRSFWAAIYAEKPEKNAAQQDRLMKAPRRHRHHCHNKQQ